jgi:predicted nucleic acid-binding protein
MFDRVDILLDTNVLVYAIDKDSKYHLWSKNFFENEKFVLYITSKNVFEFLSVVTKSSNIPLSLEEALLSIKIICSNCLILYPDYTSTQTCMDLILENNIKGLKVHDCEIASIAITNKIRRIATVNKNDFSCFSDLEIVTPT